MATVLMTLYKKLTGVEKTTDPFSKNNTNQQTSKDPNGIMEGNEQPKEGII